MQQQMFRLPYDQNLLQCPPRPALVIDRRWKSSSMVEPAPRCPRCDSSSTKFCYYNNYSLTQPRYFCKGCRRYWTKGGSLRNIPVGGGCRKNRRTKSSRLSSSSSATGQSYGRGSSDKSDGRTESSTRSGSSTDAAVTSDGSTIDLAAVYAKFLNQQPSDHESGQMTAVTELSDQFGPEPCYGFPPCPSADFGLVDSPRAVVDNITDISGVQLDHRNILPSPPISSFKPDSADYAVGQTAVGLGTDSFWTNCDQVEPDFNWQSALESTLEFDHLNLQSSFLNCSWSPSFDLSQL